MLTGADVLIFTEYMIHRGFQCGPDGALTFIAERVQSILDDIDTLMRIARRLQSDTRADFIHTLISELSRLSRLLRMVRAEDRPHHLEALTSCLAKILEIIHQERAEAQRAVEVDASDALRN